MKNSLPLFQRLGAAAAIAAIAAASVLCSPLAANAVVPVDFTGAGGLKACINTQFGAPVGDPITAVQIKTLAMLTCTSAGITTLAPLSSATGMQFLNVGENPITTLDPIAAMKNLSSLYVNGANLVDISALAGNTNLSTLVIEADTPDSALDLAPLATIPKLGYVALYGTGISDISPIAGLKKLTQLSIERTSVSDLTPLASLTSVTKLSLWESPITSIAPVANLTNLTQLSASYLQLTDASPAGSLSKLTFLALSGNQLTVVPPLTALPALKYLYLDDNNVVDLSPVAASTGLIQLWLEHNRIENLTPLVGLSAVNTLLLDDNALTDLRPVAALGALAQLTVANQHPELPAVATSQFSTAPLIYGTDGTTYGLSIDEGIGFYENGQASWSATGHTSLSWNGKVPFGAGFQTVYSGGVGQNVESPIVAGSAGVAGVASVGSVLSAIATGWTPNMALSYSWLRDGVATGVTTPTYALGAADGNHAMSVRITGSRSTLLFVSADSAPTAAVTPLPVVVITTTQQEQQPAVLQFAKHAAPKITGPVKVGKKLTAKPGKWDTGVRLSYRWMANGHAIKHATKSTLKLTRSLRHKKITVVVIATKTGYATLATKSKATKRVK